MKKKLNLLLLTIIFGIIPIGLTFAEENEGGKETEFKIEFVSATSDSIIDGAVETSTNYKKFLEEKERIEQEKLAQEEKKQGESKIFESSYAISITDEDAKLISYIQRRNPSLSTATANQIYGAVKKYTTEYNVDKYLIMAMIQNESNFTPNATGNNVYGLMQIHINTATNFGLPLNDMYNIDLNVRAGVSYISRNLQKYGSTSMALAAYAFGDGSIASGNYNLSYSNRIISLSNSIKHTVSNY